MSTEKHFAFLDDLRESGVTNMYGAAPYLKARFDMSIDDARKILGKWSRTFDRDKTPAERAKLAETEART